MTTSDRFYFWAGQEGYLAANTDTTGPSYYGFEARDEKWYIMKEVVSGAVTTYTYAKGSSNYAISWIDRANLSYASVSVTFK